MIRGINFPAIGRADRQSEQQTTGRGIFVPLVFQPGEAFQFDWSEDFAMLGGERAKLQVAHIKLSHSRAFLLRAYPLQTHEMLFDAHVHAFRVFGGVPGRGIYDSEAWPPRNVSTPTMSSTLKAHETTAKPTTLVNCHHDNQEVGWGGRDRTSECRYQKPMPYRLATPQLARCLASAPAGCKRDCGESPRPG